jgi:DNA-binding phage protein
MFGRILKEMLDVSGITRRFNAVGAILDERSRRLVAAAESAALGRGGVSAVARATGMSRQVIRQGMTELGEAAVHPPGRVRRAGGGRKKAVAQDPSLLRDLERLVEPVTRGDPESPLRWTCKSLRKLAEELRRRGHRASHPLVGRMLHDLGDFDRDLFDQRLREQAIGDFLQVMDAFIADSDQPLDSPEILWSDSQKVSKASLEDQVVFDI